MGVRVRILTANLWNGGADPSALAEILESADVDVACFQELAPEQAEAVAQVLPHGLLEPARDHCGMGIALRRPAEVDRVALPCRDARVARLAPDAWPGLAAPLEVIGVHVTGAHVWPYWRSWPIRRGQLVGLERYLAQAPRAARMLVGDLNATPLWPVYRRLARHLRDVHAEAARSRGARPAATWGPTPRSPRVLRIDHALGSGVLAGDARVLPLAGADHSALVVDVEVEPAAERSAGRPR